MQADHEIIDAILPAIRTARQAILDVYDSNHQGIEYKDDKSPVTRADKWSHDILLEALYRITPGVPVVSEEGVLSNERLSSERIWLVDPLDGTRDFLNKTGDFSINVALIDNGSPIAGIVDLPAVGLTFYTAHHSPVRCLENFTEGIPVQTTRRKWSDPLALGVSRHHKEAEERWVSDNRLAVREWVPAGGAVKFCYLANGRIDLYVRLGPTMEWDTAAGHALVEAMGGSVRNLNGNPIKYNKTDLHNPSFVAFGPLTGDGCPL